MTIYLPEDLVEDLRSRAGGNVSAYVAGLVEHEIKLRRFEEAMHLLDALPPEPEDPITDTETLLRELSEMRHPVPEAPGPTQDNGRTRAR